MDDDQNNTSADDAVEETRDDNQPAVGQQGLTEDNDSPAALAAPTTDAAPAQDDPSSDTDVDSSETYENGQAS